MVDTGESTVGVRVFPSRKPGAPTLAAAGPEGEIYLHSSYDPFQEAAKWAEKHLENFSGDTVIVFGLGLGYHVEALLEQSPGLERITVIDVNPAAFNAALSARFLGKLLSCSKLHLIAGSYPDISQNVRESVDRVSAHGSAGIFVHAPSLKIYPPEAYELKDILNYILLSARKSEVFPQLKKENAACNAEAFDAAAGVSELFGSLAGKPAIVAAAGPSLDTSLNLLKSSIAEPVIIVVDSALAPFQASGIRPDFVVTGDPQPEAFKLFEGLRITTEKLIFFPSSCPDAVEYFPAENRFAACSSVQAGQEKTGDDLGGFTKGELFFSGTVFLAAVDFAVKSGASPVAIIGADFSFIDARTHASSSRTQGYNPRFGNLRETPGLDGNPVKTSDILYLYLRDFEAYCAAQCGNATIINCTARGAKTEGIPHKQFASFLEECAG